jgi:hypothetical protein
MSSQRCRSEVILATYAEWRYVRAMSLFLAILVVLAILLLFARPSLLLPLIGVISLTCAVVALAVWVSSEQSRARFNLRELPSAYAFTGFADAMVKQASAESRLSACATDVSVRLKK